MRKLDQWPDAKNVFHLFDGQSPLHKSVQSAKRAFPCSLKRKIADRDDGNAFCNFAELSVSEANALFENIAKVGSYDKLITLGKGSIVDALEETTEKEYFIGDIDEIFHSAVKTGFIHKVIQDGHQHWKTDIYQDVSDNLNVCILEGWRPGDSRKNYYYLKWDSETEGSSLQKVIFDFFVKEKLYPEFDQFSVSLGTKICEHTKQKCAIVSTDTDMLPILLCAQNDNLVLWQSKQCWVVSQIDEIVKAFYLVFLCCAGGCDFCEGTAQVGATTIFDLLQSNAKYKEFYKMVESVHYTKKESIDKFKENANAFNSEKEIVKVPFLFKGRDTLFRIKKNEICSFFAKLQPERKQKEYTPDQLIYFVLRACFTVAYFSRSNALDINNFVVKSPRSDLFLSAVGYNPPSYEYINNMQMFDKQLPKRPKLEKDCQSFNKTKI